MTVRRVVWTRSEMAGMVLAGLWSGSALAEDFPATETPTSALVEAQGRAVQLGQEMTKLARRNAWDGVDLAWRELHSLGVPVDFQLDALGAEAARHRGHIWDAYQRSTQVLRLKPGDESLVRQIEDLRSRFGRLTVRRVDSTPIELVPVEMPFDADERRAIETATEQLRTTGAYDGMIPAGAYTVGSNSILIEAGLTPVIIQRKPGDAQTR